MKKGFTILELLVVISVLVILIGIAIPRFKGMQDAGRVAQAKGELQTVQTAIESYYMNASPNAYPSSSTNARFNRTRIILWENLNVCQSLFFGYYLGAFIRCFFKR